MDRSNIINNYKINKIMALLLKEFYLKKKHDNVYAKIEFVNTYNSEANVLVHFWNEDKTEIVHSWNYLIPFDKKEKSNLYTYCYNELKKLDEFSNAIDV